MSELLKDPESARYSFEDPQQAWLPRYHFDSRVDGQPLQRGQVFGWRVHFTVNAKNGYGGYTGGHAYEAFFQRGHLRAILEQGKYKDIFGYPTWDLLASLPTAD